MTEKPWQWGINDPTVMGWVVTIAYLGAAAVSLVAARKGANAIRAERLGWLGLALVLIFLGLNKELDLQTPGFNRTRELAVEQGWYSSRRIVVGLFIVGSITILSLVTREVLKRIPRSAGNLRRALVCMAGLFAILALPFLSFRPLSVFLHFTFFGVGPEVWRFQMRELLELGLIVVIAILGWRRLHRNPIPVPT